jgi:hypothetical protein
MRANLEEKKIYEELSKKELSPEEYIEAKQNFVGFFDLLYRIDKRLSKNKEVSSESPFN